MSILRFSPFHTRIMQAVFENDDKFKGEKMISWQLGMVSEDG